MDINVDLGESLKFLKNGSDESFMPLVDSVNIASTYHAGSTYILSKTIENALRYSCKIGIHTGFKDPENFGRKEILLSKVEIKDLIYKQYEIFMKILEGFKVPLNHHKPHGALYNLSVKNKLYAEAIAEATLELNPEMYLYVLYHSESQNEASRLGLKYLTECFADRAYHTNGSLVSRQLAGSVLHDSIQIDQQIHGLWHKKPILTYEKTEIIIEADSICVHSDSPDGLAMAQKLFSLKTHEK